MQDIPIAFTDAYLVRLDVGTGTCVHVQQLGGDQGGWTDDVHIALVDEPMPDALFTEQPRR